MLICRFIAICEYFYKKEKKCFVMLGTFILNEVLIIYTNCYCFRRIIDTCES